MKSKILSFAIATFFIAFSSRSVFALEEDLFHYIFPKESHLPSFEHYFPFVLQSTKSSTDKIFFTYQADFENFLSQEGLSFQISFWELPDETSAEKTFHEIRGESDKPYFQYGNPNDFSDPLEWIQSPNRSYHGLFLNRNRLFQYSLFQKNRIFNPENYAHYKDILDQNQELENLFQNLHEEILKKDAIFNQLQGDFYASRENANKKILLDSTSPHQSFQFNISADASKNNKGTLLDSSGALEAKPGDFYVYLLEDKRLELGVYAPDIPSNCDVKSGWHRLQSKNALQDYEWNPVQIIFGVGGLSLKLNQERVSCGLNQGLGKDTFYLGDYPLDLISQSAVFVLQNLQIYESKSSTHESWSSLLNRFAVPEDIAWDHPDYEALFYFFQTRASTHRELKENQALTRVQFIQDLYENYHISPDHLFKKLPFKDTPQSKKDRQWIQSAYEDGLLKNSEFARPYDLINRAEALTLLARFRRYQNIQPLHYVDVSTEAWYLSGASYASLKKLIRGEFFEAGKIMTHGDLARLFFELNH